VSRPSAAEPVEPVRLAVLDVDALSADQGRAGDGELDDGRLWRRVVEHGRADDAPGDTADGDGELAGGRHALRGVQQLLVELEQDAAGSATATGVASAAATTAIAATAGPPLAAAVPAEIRATLVPATMTMTATTPSSA
jgi:hypothetical protein